MSMIRRLAKYGADLLPTPSHALAACDPWVISSSNSQLTGHRGVVQRTVELLLKRDAPAAYYLFNSAIGTTKFPVSALSRLLSIFPSGSESAHVWWPRARRVAAELGSQAQASDYAVLINLASKAGDFKSVNYLWQTMSELGVARNTNVWNQYIQAVCGADSRFWPWPLPRERATPSFKTHIAKTNHKTNYLVDVFELLGLMEIEGVPANSRTHELVLLSVARQQHQLSDGGQQAADVCEDIVSRLWLAKDGHTDHTVTPSTHLAIIEAFAFNNQVGRGYELCQKLGSLPPSSSAFWKRALRRSAHLPELNARIWSGCVASGTPTTGAYWIRSEVLERCSSFDEMMSLVPSLPTAQLRESVMRRAVVGLANTNRALDALKHLQSLEDSKIEVDSGLLAKIESYGVSLEQLKLFEEDDDEDGLV